MSITRLAVLTSGGDAPGMNAAIRSTVRTATSLGIETFGVRCGFRGLMDGDLFPLGPRDVGGILTRGGTILGSARAPDFRTIEGRNSAIAKLGQHGIDGVVVIGGNGSQTGSLALSQAGVAVCGVASTIDNDLAEVDTSIGVDSALNAAVWMVDRLRDTATSHHRAFVVEIMGRHSGYLALMTGIACGAEIMLLPERPVAAEQVLAQLEAAYAQQKSHFIVIAAEGSPLKAATLVEQMNAAPGQYEARLSVLGHVQRGGAPLVFDRLLATRSAAAAVHALADGKSGLLAGLAHGHIDLIPLGAAIKPTNKVSDQLCRMADVLSE